MIKGEDIGKLKNQIDCVGLTLADLEALVSRLTLPCPIKYITAQRYHTSSLTIDTFRALIVESLAQPNAGLVLNFDGALLPNNYKIDVGHHSPIAAYHPERDLVLLADVWPWCPVAWHTVNELWTAANSIDSDSHEHRGILKVTIDK